MATGAYEGGIGGKIRRRPQRPAQGTPYDRPAASARGPRAIPPSADSNGWLSRLVDPASRFIANSASKLLSSVFRKSLPPPLPALGENLQSGREVPETISVNPSSEILHVGCKDGKNIENISEDKGIYELEKLLMQKTFTRAEFDQLTELLHSRTVELDLMNPARNTEEMIEETISTREKEGGFRSHETSSHPGGPIAINLLAIPQDEAASPAELAKTYMSSKSTKGSPSNLGLRSRLFLEDKASDTAYAMKPSGLTSVPRSIAQVSRLVEPPENAYMTPRSRGRSAIYRMSRSPFFKGVNSSIDVSRVPSSSRQTPMSIHSGGRQLLKRRSAFLDYEIGSVGPIRRIRQKSNMMSPFKNTRPGHHGNLLLSHSTVPAEDVLDIASSRSTLAVNKLIYGNTNVQGINDVPPIPLKSNQMAMKILKQLDNMTPSPKGKSSEPNGVGGDEQPLKRAQDVLQRYVFKNTKDADSSQIIDAQRNSNKDVSGDSSLPGIKISSPRQDEIKGNNVSNLAVSGVDFASHGHGMNTVKSAPSAMFGKSHVEELSNSSSFPLGGKSGFQMAIPEGSLELDDVHLREASVPVNNANDKVKSKILDQKLVLEIQDNKPSTPETPISERPVLSLSGNKPLSSLVSSSGFDKKSPLSSVIGDINAGFAFNFGAASCSHSEPPPTPTMPLPANGVSSKENEQRNAPVFTFGLQQSSAFALTSSTTGSCGKVDKSFAETTTILDGSALDKGNESLKERELLRPPEKFASSEASTLSLSPASASGVAASSSLSNGLLHSTPKFSAAPILTPSDRHVNLISSAAPAFAMAHPFQFGSSASTALKTVASQPPNDSRFTDAEEKPTRKAAFGIDGVSSVGTSASLSTGSSSSLNLVTSPIFSSGDIATSSMATPPTISSTSWSNTPAASQFAFSSTGNSSFLSSAAALSTSTSSSVTFGTTTGAAYGSQSAQSDTGIQQVSQSMTGGQSASAPQFAFTSTGSSSFLSSAAAQSTGTSSSVAFGATGPANGSQSALSYTGIQQACQSSGSHFSSLASPETFGPASSSPGFGSPFGLSATTSKPPSSSSGFTFPSAAAASSVAISSSQPVASNIFSSAPMASTTPIFSTTFGSNASPSTGFAFGQASASTLTSSFNFSAQPTTGFSFTSASTTVNSSSCFGSGSPANDQMNVEDSMVDDTSQAANSMIPTFGQPGSSPSTPLFSTPAIPSGGSIFQFGNNQNPVLQSPSPFQASGGIDFAPTGSFSLGSGGGDKSTRRYVKVRRQKK